MTIEQLDERKVLISLGSEDMKNFELEFENMSFYSEHSKRVLLRLLRLACMKAGLSHKRKTMLMEALPHRSGCLILVTLMEESRPKVYRVKDVSMRYCFIFEDAEALLSAAQALYEGKHRLFANSLWLSENRYYLVFDSPLLKLKADTLLSRYGKKQRCTKPQLARLMERGRLLCGGNALEYIGRKILEQSSYI